jgi:hypothetical protein
MPANNLVVVTNGAHATRWLNLDGVFRVDGEPSRINRPASRAAKNIVRP